MQTSYIILVSDYDNTFNRSGKPEIIHRNISAIERFRKQGNVFIIATTRSLKNLRMDFPEVDNLVDYVIADNGAMIYEGTQRIIREIHFKAKELEEIKNIVSDFNLKCDGQVEPIYYSRGDEFQNCAGIEGVTKVRLWVKNNNVCDDIIHRVEKYTSLIHYCYKNLSDLHDLYLPWITENYKNCIELFPVLASKHFAFARISATLSTMVSPYLRSVAIGDSQVDMGLISALDGYAISGSHPEIVAVAGKMVDEVYDLVDLLLGET